MESEVRWTLVPRKTAPPNHHEAVEIIDAGGFPAAIVHIDTFHMKDGELYRRLRDGEKLTVTVSVVVEE